MELKQLRSFAVVARTLSFSRAAVELQLSQPVLSAQILALEADLGVRLLDRNRRMKAARWTPRWYSSRQEWEWPFCRRESRGAIDRHCR